MDKYDWPAIFLSCYRALGENPALLWRDLGALTGMRFTTLHSYAQRHAPSLVKMLARKAVRGHPNWSSLPSPPRYTRMAR